MAPAESRLLERIGDFVRGPGTGPAIYIVGCGLIFCIASIAMISEYRSFVWGTPMVGSIVGGIMYRIRSSGWPIDPTAWKRRLYFALLSILLGPFVVFLLTGFRAHGLQIGILATCIGVSVACGIFVAGDRRNGRYEDRLAADGELNAG